MATAKRPAPHSSVYTALASADEQQMELRTISYRLQASDIGEADDLATVRRGLAMAAKGLESLERRNLEEDALHNAIEPACTLLAAAHREVEAVIATIHDTAEQAQLAEIAARLDAALSLLQPKRVRAVPAGQAVLLEA